MGGLHGKVAAEYLGSTLAFDFRFATEDTTIMFNNVALGFQVSGALAFFLPRYVGPAKATELLISNETITAQQALELGLISDIVAPDGLEDRCRQKLAEIAKLPMSAVAATRRLLQPESMEVERFLERSFKAIYIAGIRKTR